MAGRRARNMSVPVNQRSHGKLEACVRAHGLCAYTLQITANKNVFTVEYQAALTDRIIATALNIHTLTWSANNTLVKTPEDLRKRQKLQEDAAIQCNILLSLIEIAKPIFHLTTKRVVYWSSMAIETRGLIRAWKETDARRYKEKTGV